MVYIHAVGQQDILKIMAELNSILRCVIVYVTEGCKKILVTYITNSTTVSLLIRQHKSGTKWGGNLTKRFVSYMYM